MAAVVKETDFTVIVLGGEDERGNSLKSVACFRFDRNIWEELPSMYMRQDAGLRTAVVCWIFFYD